MWNVEANDFIYFFLCNTSWAASDSAQPYQSVMSLDHLLAGLPRGRSPLTLSTITVFISRSSCILQMTRVSIASSFSTVVYFFLTILLTVFVSPSHFYYSPVAYHLIKQLSHFHYFASFSSVDRIMFISVIAVSRPQ